MGLPPIGCAPYYLQRYKSNNGECVEEINDMIMEFNFFMRYMTDELLHELPDAGIIFCDVFQGSMDIIRNHKNYGMIIQILNCVFLYAFCLRSLITF